LACQTGHGTAQHSTALHSTALHSTAQHRTAQHSTAQHSTAQHSTAQHSTAQHSTAQHSTALLRTCCMCSKEQAVQTFIQQQNLLRMKQTRSHKGSALRFSTAQDLQVHIMHNVCTAM